MICNNCGKEIGQGCLFCAYCGRRAETPEPVAENRPETIEIEIPTEAPVEKAVEKTAAEPVPAPTPAPVPTPATIPAPAPVPTPVETRVSNSFSSPVPPPPPMPGAQNRKPPKEEKPKTFFGKGALAICLIIIGLLSCSTTVFATLFFTLLGRM